MPSIRNLYNMKIKKAIGSLGRKYGGKPFQIIRKFYYDTFFFLTQLIDIFYIYLNKYTPGNRDSIFYRDNYSPNAKNNSKIKKGIIFLCDGKFFHGGPTDRLRGILSTYEVAKKKGIPFYIAWTSPFRLENFLIPSTFDWTIQESEISYSSNDSFPIIIEDVNNFYSGLRLSAGLHNKKNQWHVYSNGDNSIGRYKSLFNELFKPSEKLQAEVDRHLNELGDDYWAFTFRFLQLLGDFKDWSQTTLDNAEAIDFMNKVKNEFVKLLTNASSDIKILVTSDSKRFLEFIADADPRIYIVPGDVKNIDLLKNEEYPDAWMKTFTDQQLLMRAQKVFLLRTGGMYKSGFPRFAAEVGGAEFIYHEF